MMMTLYSNPPALSSYTLLEEVELHCPNGNSRWVVDFLRCIRSQKIRRLSVVHSCHGQPMEWTMRQWSDAQVDDILSESPFTHLQQFRMCFLCSTAETTETFAARRLWGAQRAPGGEVVPRAALAGLWCGPAWDLSLHTYVGHFKAPAPGSTSPRHIRTYEYVYCTAPEAAATVRLRPRRTRAPASALVPSQRRWA